MLRSAYDTDCVTWSPQGRLFQVEYSVEAVRQGSICVGLRNNQFALLVTLNRSPSDLADHQQKIYKVDDHLGLAFAGLTSDARLLTRFMRNEALNHKYAYSTPVNPGRLVAKIGDKSQIKTQRYGKRPYGVGLLIAGVDEAGPHIYETCPDANYFEYFAFAIGARCQSAKTYLENHFKDFDGMGLEDLIRAGIRSVRKSTPEEIELNNQNVSVAVVGIERAFDLLGAEELDPYLAEIAAEQAAAMQVEDEQPNA